MVFGHQRTARAESSTLSAASHQPACARSTLGSASSPPDAQTLKLVVTHAVRTLFGEVGAAMPVDLLSYDAKLREAILRVRSR